MTSCLTAFNSNDLEEYYMNAGDDHDFTYVLYDEEGALLDITTAECSSVIFRYGDPSAIVLNLTGTVSGTETGQFSVTLDSADTIGLSGTYQHQPRVIDALGRIHFPSRGKIVIYPSPALA